MGKKWETVFFYLMHTTCKDSNEEELDKQGKSRDPIFPHILSYTFSFSLEIFSIADADTLKTICNSNLAHGHALQYETSISLSPR